MDILWIVFVPFFFFFMVIFGLFRRPCNCPECGERLSPLQNPFKKTRRQWLFGGYTCGKCGCEVDLEGNVVSKQNRSPLPYVAGMMSLLLFLAGIGCMHEHAADATLRGLIIGGNSDKGDATSSSFR